MGSTRLPGKSMRDLVGEPMLKRVVDRIRLSTKVDAVILATTVSPADDLLERFAIQEGLCCFRGSEENVLERVVLAAKQQKVENIVELHGDNPFLDPEIIDAAVNLYEDTGCDYVSNTLEKTFPMGVRVQVFSTESLEKIFRTVVDPAVREHVSLHYYEHPELYRIVNLEAPPTLRRPDIRLTVDTVQDLQFASAIYDVLIERGIVGSFTTTDVLEVIDSDLVTITNAEVATKPIRG